MNTKKILLALASFLVVAGGVVAMSAYEAHIVNVTATIENALTVTPNSLEFGTVFPNESLDETLTIALSESFLAEDRVDDVEYDIIQKAKPRADVDHEYCVAQLEDAEDCVYQNMYMGLEGAILYCYGNYDTTDCYPPLCPFLSKLPDLNPDNDGPAIGTPHQPGATTRGYLSKDDGDVVDIWTIDLSVPCFIGNCVQGETGLLPLDWESEVFGCDLWVEVTRISED